MSNTAGSSRRAFLATACTAGLAGCGEVRSGTSTETETDSPWPKNTTDSSPENGERTWKGGDRDVSMTGGKVVLDETSVDVLGSSVAQQVGVSTSETDLRNEADIPDSEFEWYQASDNAFIWLVFVEFLRSEDGDRVAPDPDLWRVQPILEEEGEQPVRSFTSSFDPDPTYYRIPKYHGHEYTHHAYANINERYWLQAMAFEIEATSIELLCGDPPKSAWYFEVDK